MDEKEVDWASLQERLRNGDSEAAEIVAEKLSSKSRFGKNVQTATNAAALQVLNKLKAGQDIENPEGLMKFLRRLHEIEKFRKEEKTQKRIPKSQQDPFEDKERSQKNGVTPLKEAELMEGFWLVFNSLRETTREVLLKHCDGMPHEQIAESIEDFSIHKVRRALEEAEIRLRKFLVQ